MRSAFVLLLILLWTPVFQARAQGVRGAFDAGGLAVLSLYQGTDLQAPIPSTIGFHNGAAGGLFFGQTAGDRLGGELRYMFSENNLKLNAGGAQVNLNARSHIFHYDLLVYATPRGAFIRPYAAGGGGLKAYQATGFPLPVQPFAGIALLTRRHQTVGVVDFGGGLKFRTSHNTHLRVEVRDYISEVPLNLFAGAKPIGHVFQWMPSIGFGWTF
jgi:hypothetical protein